MPLRRCGHGDRSPDSANFLIIASSKVRFDVGRLQLLTFFSLHFPVGAVREAGSAFS
ncbi:hypothetical protein CKA32_000088 [Geitlerinema sp. FC II]|nr:hypothetical protein CKA32_000088 [Geitlerinema sp. FC II]